MYKVKGADGGVYGPVLAVVIQQWIAERRLNGDSLVSPDGGEDWRPLRDYPEFAAALVSAALPPTSTQGGWGDARTGRDGALAVAKTPGLLLVVFGAIMAMFTLIGMASMAAQAPGTMPTLPPETPEWLRNLMQMQANMPPWVSWAQVALGLVVDVLIIVGGVQLMRLGNRGLAMTAGILVMVPCFTSCCCLLGLPLGIWVVQLCSASNVRPHFRA